MWFQQGGARSHIVNLVRLYLQDPNRFGGRAIGQHLDNHWPARPSDLTVCDFFLWGYLKDEVSKKGVLCGRAALKDAVEDIISNMSRQMCTQACQCVLKRIYVLKLRGGRHTEQTLKTVFLNTNNSAF